MFKFRQTPYAAIFYQQYVSEFGKCDLNFNLTIVKRLEGELRVNRGERSILLFRNNVFRRNYRRFSRSIPLFLFVADYLKNSSSTKRLRFSGVICRHRSWIAVWMTYDVRPAGCRQLTAATARFHIFPGRKRNSPGDWKTINLAQPIAFKTALKRFGFRFRRRNYSENTRKPPT